MASWWRTTRSIDPDLAIDVLHLVAPDIEVLVRRPIVLEHSNSSVIFDEATILKVFRKIERGPNPDAEITRVLAEQGYANVLPPLAELRRDDTDLAVARTYLVEATEGWDIARTSVRDLLASRLPPEECGGDFGPDSTRLGATIAGLHLAMAAAWGTSPGSPASWVAEMEAHLEESLVEVQIRAAHVDVDLDVIRARYRAAAAIPDGGGEIRVHGDLHLAQVMKVDAGWIVLDFEGEPSRRRADRFTRSSPLRDVAGMLRSLHYAASTVLSEWGLEDAELAGLAAAWEERNRVAFLEGYFGHRGDRCAAAGRRGQPRDPPRRLRARQGRVRARLRARPPSGQGVDPARRHRPPGPPPRRDVSAPTDLDLHLFAEGTHRRLWEVLGSHVTEVDGAAGTDFAVWAPHAQAVAVAGPWNHWDVDGHPLTRVSDGVWGGFVAGLGNRTPYKYAITRPDGTVRLHADPMAQFAEHSGGMASIVFDSQHTWGDGGWMAARPDGDPVDRPDQRVRGAPRILAAAPRRALPQLPGGGPAPRRPRPRARLHARRAHARGRAPLRAVLGLPGHRVLRPDLALR